MLLVKADDDMLPMRGCSYKSDEPSIALRPGLAHANVTENNDLRWVEILNEFGGQAVIADYEPKPSGPYLVGIRLNQVSQTTMCSDEPSLGSRQYLGSLPCRPVLAFVMATGRGLVVMGYVCAASKSGPGIVHSAASDRRYY